MAILLGFHGIENKKHLIQPLLSQLQTKEGSILLNESRQIHIGDHVGLVKDIGEQLQRAVTLQVAE